MWRRGDVLIRIQSALQNLDDEQPFTLGEQPDPLVKFWCHPGCKLNDTVRASQGAPVEPVVAAGFHSGAQHLRFDQVSTSFFRRWGCAERASLLQLGHIN